MNATLLSFIITREGGGVASRVGGVRRESQQLGSCHASRFDAPRLCLDASGFPPGFTEATPLNLKWVLSAPGYTDYINFVFQVGLCFRWVLDYSVRIIPILIYNFRDKLLKKYFIDKLLKKQVGTIQVQPVKCVCT